MYRNGCDATIGLAPLLILHATVRSNFRGSLLSRNSKACCGALSLEHIVRSHARAGAKGDAILRGGQRKESKLDLKNMISGGVLPKSIVFLPFLRKLMYGRQARTVINRKPTKQTSFSRQCYFTTPQLSLKALLFFAARSRSVPWLASRCS